MSRDAGDASRGVTPSAAHRGPSSVAAIFGPGIAIGEMFAYLGGAFVLGAFETFVVRSSAGIEGRSFLTLTIGMAVAAIALTACGLFLRKGDARRRRAAGVVFALAVYTSRPPSRLARKVRASDGPRSAPSVPAWRRSPHSATA